MKMDHSSPTLALSLAFQTASLRGPDPAVAIREGLQIGVVEADSSVPIEIAELSRELFFGSGDRLSATLGRIHPDLPKGTIHPSTSDALSSLVRWLRLGKSIFVKEIREERLEGSAAVLGGPAANLHARLILGCGDVSPLFGVKPPVTFDCVSLSKKGVPWRKEPWKVVVQGRSSEKECLVITSVPMDNTKDRLTIFSGLRPAGTKAIELLLNSPTLLWTLYSKTRTLMAWQAIIEVYADDFEVPLALGDSAVFDLSKTNFADPNVSVRKNMFMNAETIKKICDLLPLREGVDLGDSNNTGVIELAAHRLYKSRKHDNLSRGSLAAPHSAAFAEGQRNLPISRGTVPRLEDGAAHKPQTSEANMRHVITASPVVAKARRGRGRPPKEKSGASLTHRLQIMLSTEDIQRIERIKELTGADSMGAAIRASLRAEYDRLVTGHHRPAKA